MVLWAALLNCFESLLLSSIKIIGCKFSTCRVKYESVENIDKYGGKKDLVLIVDFAQVFTYIGETGRDGFD